MSRIQPQSLQSYLRQTKQDGQHHSIQSGAIPSTVHSCENPFRFIQKNFQDFGESFDEKANDANRNPQNINDDEDISQRKSNTKRPNIQDNIKHYQLTSQKKDNILANQESTGCLKQLLIQQTTFQKGQNFIYKDVNGSQKKINDLHEGNFQSQQQNQARQSSNSKLNEGQMNTIEILKAEINYLKKELYSQENMNYKLNQGLQYKQIEDLQKEFELNNQNQQQPQLLKFNRENNSRSRDSIKNTTHHTAYQEQKLVNIEQLFVYY